MTFKIILMEVMTCMQQIFVCMNHEQNAKYRGDINVMNVVVIAMVIAIFVSNFLCLQQSLYSLITLFTSLIMNII